MFILVGLKRMLILNIFFLVPLMIVQFLMARRIIFVDYAEYFFANRMIWLLPINIIIWMALVYMLGTGIYGLLVQKEKQDIVVLLKRIEKNPRQQLKEKERNRTIKWMMKWHMLWTQYFISKPQAMKRGKWKNKYEYDVDFYIFMMKLYHNPSMAKLRYEFTEEAYAKLVTDEIYSIQCSLGSD